MTEQNELRDVISKLEDIELQINNGVAAIEGIAELLHGDTEGPALYFLAEGFTAQQVKLKAIIDTAMKARRVERLQAVS